MLNLLDEFQHGLISPTSFMRAIVTDRVQKMELSSGLIETLNTVVTCVDIDRVEDTYLLSGYNDGQIAITKLNTSNLAMCLQEGYTCAYECNILARTRAQDVHTFSTETVQWYPYDNGLFTSSGMDQKLKLWDTARLKVVDTFTLPNKVYQHNMSTIATHHSLIAAAMFHPQVILVDIRSGSQSHHLQGHHTAVHSVQWSPFAENLLATGGVDNRILLWDIRSAKGYLTCLDQYNGEALSGRKDFLSAHNGKINSLCFTSDGLYLVSFGTDHSIKLWDVAMAKNTLVNFGKIFNPYLKKVQMDVCCETLTPILFVPSQKQIKVFDLFTGTQINSLCGHMINVSCCAFRKQFHELYSAGNDRQILIWSTEDLNYTKLERKEIDPRCKDLWSDDSDSGVV